MVTLLQQEYNESDQRIDDVQDECLYETLECEYVGNGRYFFDKDDDE